jgi:hypothetical protein
VYEAAVQTYAQMCGACGQAMRKEGLLDTVVACGHPMHVECITFASKTEACKLGAVFGAKHCLHCRDSIARGFDKANDHHFDKQATPEFCLAQLKAAHRLTYPRLKLDESFGSLLTHERTMQLLGEPVGPLKSASQMFGSLFAFVGQAEADASPEQHGALRGTEFIAECNRRGKTIADILSNGGTIADVWNCGVQTMDELRKIGFSATTHFAFRSVLPIHVLVEKFGASYERDMKDHMTNEQLIACKLTRFDLPLLGLAADALVARNFTQEELAKFADIGLADWIRYGHLHMSHAIRMRMTGAFAWKTWRADMVPDTAAFTLYGDLCAVNGEPAKRLKKKEKR